jgi:hypothetical protein
MKNKKNSPSTSAFD